MNTETTATQFRRMIVMTALSALALGFSVASSAADQGDAHQVTVKYGDLALTQPGAVALYSRIRAAAEGVCKNSEDRILSFKASQDACVHKAIADAIAKIGQPALTAVYYSKNGSSPTVILASNHR